MMPVVTITLNRRGKPPASAEIDDVDLPIVSQHRWYVLKPRGSHTQYARAIHNGKTIYLHRLLMAAEAGDEIDHIDGNGLNNQRANLRFVTHAENLQSAARMPGRYGNPTHEQLDRELEEWLARNDPATPPVKRL